MSSQDRYITELDPKTSSEISGTYVTVVQAPGGGANTTFSLTIAELVQWIQDNTNYTEVYDLPIEEDTETGDVTISVNSGVDETIHILGANGNVGIGTVSPTAKLEIYSSDDDNGDLMFTPTSGDKMGIHATPTDGGTDAALAIGRKITGTDATFISLAQIDKNGNVEFNLINNETIVTANGFSVFGDDTSAPEIKMIKLSGTTGAVDTEVYVAHGIDYTKIISCNVLVYNDVVSAWVSPNDSLNANSGFAFRININNLYVTLAADATAIATNDFVATIIYTRT